MKTLYIDKSAGDARDGGWVGRLDLAGVGRIVVGTGPGSFAGIRSAIAFAQGYSIATGCEVLGLPSACAFAREGEDVAVVGDARRGLFWVALLHGYALVRDVFQVAEDGLATAVPDGFAVTSPDDSRIGGLLRGVFGECYDGGGAADPDGLRRFAEANPGALVREPLPLYLNPAVRP